MASSDLLHCKPTTLALTVSSTMKIVFCFSLSKPPDSPKPHPLSHYTPEAYEAMRKAQCETEKSKNLRKKIATCIGM